jgi:glycosyltransferase involved in cell wall biosynthesis
MKKKILFSIIIPTYNRENKLKKAIDSVLSQKFKNWEIVVIDNYSKDNTKKLVQSYKNEYINFFRIKNYGVIAKSRNFGILKSKGKFIAFLDSDDIWTDEKLYECNKIIKINPDVKLIYHNMNIKKSSEKIYSKKVEYFRALSKPIKNDLIINGPAFPTSSVVVDKKIFKKINCFNENKEFIAWEDFDAWIRLASKTSNFQEINKILGYLINDETSTNNARRQIKNIYTFKNLYLKKMELDFTEWCNYSLMRSFLKIGKFNKSIFFLKKLKYKIFDTPKNIKIIIFFILNIFRIRY